MKKMMKNKMSENLLSSVIKAATSNSSVAGPTGFVRPVPIYTVNWIFEEGKIEIEEKGKNPFIAY